MKFPYAHKFDLSKTEKSKLKKWIKINLSKIADDYDTLTEICDTLVFNDMDPKDVWKVRVNLLKKRDKEIGGQNGH